MEFIVEFYFLADFTAVLSALRREDPHALNMLRSIQPTLVSYRVPMLLAACGTRWALAITVFRMCLQTRRDTVDESACRIVLTAVRKHCGTPWAVGLDVLRAWGAQSAIPDSVVRLVPPGPEGMTTNDICIMLENTSVEDMALKTLVTSYFMEAARRRDMVGILRTWNVLASSRKSMVATNPVYLQGAMFSLHMCRAFVQSRRVHAEAICAYPGLDTTPLLWCHAAIAMSRSGDISGGTTYLHRATSGHGIITMPRQFLPVLFDASWEVAAAAWVIGQERNWVPSDDKHIAMIMRSLNRSQRWAEGLAMLASVKNPESVCHHRVLATALVQTLNAHPHPNMWLRAVRFLSHEVGPSMASRSLWEAIFHPRMPWDVVLRLWAAIPDAVVTSSRNGKLRCHALDVLANHGRWDLVIALWMRAPTVERANVAPYVTHLVAHPPTVLSVAMYSHLTLRSDTPLVIAMRTLPSWAPTLLTFVRATTSIVPSNKGISSYCKTGNSWVVACSLAALRMERGQSLTSVVWSHILRNLMELSEGPWDVIKDIRERMPSTFLGDSSFE